MSFHLIKSLFAGASTGVGISFLVWTLFVAPVNKNTSIDRYEKLLVLVVGAIASVSSGLVSTWAFNVHMVTYRSDLIPPTPDEANSEEELSTIPTVPSTSFQSSQNYNANSLIQAPVSDRIPSIRDEGVHSKEPSTIPTVPSSSFQSSLAYSTNGHAQTEVEDLW